MGRHSFARRRLVFLRLKVTSFAIAILLLTAAVILSVLEVRVAAVVAFSRGTVLIRLLLLLWRSHAQTDASTWPRGSVVTGEVCVCEHVCVPQALASDVQSQTRESQRGRPTDHVLVDLSRALGHGCSRDPTRRGG